MAEKLDLFELSIKRGLENAEEAWNESDWNSMEKRLDGLAGEGASALGSSFLSNFGLAAAALAGLAIFYINPGTTVKEHDYHTEVVQIDMSHDDIDRKGNDANNNTLLIDADSILESGMDVDQDATSTAEMNSAAEAETAKKHQSALTKAEEARIISINERLRKAVEAKAENNDSSEKRFTTRYVGKDFDLGAARSFSPNNDGVRDFFIPITLKEGDLFVMSITDDSGRLIYRTKDVLKPWVGKDNAGKTMSAGHYSWEVIVQKDTKKEIFKGVVKLER
jgi:gliding motility-associated-like protein